jgi:Ca2+-binding RTX toxin-like protein
MSTALPAEIRVNSYTKDNQAGSSITALADGGWLVTWDSYGQDGSFEGIYQQRYAASGDKAGGEIRVNTTTVGEQFKPSVTALADGGWLVTWTSYEQDFDWYNIYQQRYAASGAKVGTETRVTTNTVDDYADPSVIGLKDGGWIVTWTSLQPGNTHDVHQQRFSADGQALGPTGPATLSLAAQAVSEGKPGSAGQLTVGAFDTSQGYTYTLLDDAGGRFAVTQSGTLVVQSGIKLDYEQATSHQVRVQVQDKVTGRTFAQAYQVSVADVASENLTGSAAADVLKGGRFGDTFRGSGGNDKLYGGLGNDKLYGGSGRDSFVFDTRLSKSTNVDKVYDFKSRDDSFQLENSIFTKLGKGSSKGVKFKSDMFVEGKKAQDREDRIVYDKKTGALYYDQDGTGSKAQVKIATITNKTKLYYHDFFVI